MIKNGFLNAWRDIWVSWLDLIPAEELWMRKFAAFVVAGMLGSWVLAGNAAEHRLSITPEDLKHLRLNPALSGSAALQSERPLRETGKPAQGSEFGGKFREALANEEDALRDLRAREVERDTQLRMERVQERHRQSNEVPRRGRSPDSQAGRAELSFGTNGAHVTSCRVGEPGTYKCDAREMR